MVLHHQHHHDHRSAFSLTALSYSIHVHRVFAPAELIHQHFVSCEHHWDHARCAEQAKVAPEQHGEVKKSILLRSIIMVWSYHTATVVGFNRSHHKITKTYTLNHITRSCRAAEEDILTLHSHNMVFSHFKCDISNIFHMWIIQRLCMCFYFSLFLYYCKLNWTNCFISLIFIFIFHPCDFSPWFTYFHVMYFHIICIFLLFMILHINLYNFHILSTSCYAFLFYLHDIYIYFSCNFSHLIQSVQHFNYATV